MQTALKNRKDARLALIHTQRMQIKTCWYFQVVENRMIENTGWRCSEMDILTPYRWECKLEQCLKGTLAASSGITNAYMLFGPEVLLY